MIAATLLRVARRLPAPAGWAIGFALRWFAGTLPLDRLLCTRRVVVYRHPRPSYEDHLLIVPRQHIATLLDLASSGRTRPFADILIAARYAVRLCRLPGDGYTLIANGGLRQETPHVHFHLFGGQAVARPYDGEAWWSLMDLPGGGEVVAHPSGDWATHLLMLPGARLPPLSRMNANNLVELARMLAALSDLDARFGLERNGYALVIQERGAIEQDQFVAHIVSGRRAG